MVAMSGGVDSALAAALLRRAGADVMGVHMRVWHGENCEDDLNGKIGTCCSPADANDARRVAEQMDFPFYSMDFETDFRRAVIDPFIADYLNGRTPNPCVHCNTQLKLGTLLAKAKAYGADTVATGHYARIRRGEGGRSELLRAVDREKDQSYYLFELRQPQLARFEMPLGEITKAETRALARELGLHLADKPESQDICFVPEGNYRDFLRAETDLDETKMAGTIEDVRGEILGRHGGIHNFTIGQRRGIGVSGPRPLYVVDLRPETRTVVVGEAEDVLSPGLVARGLNWIDREPTEGPIRVAAQIRYRHKAVPATLTTTEDEPAFSSARIEFDEPQMAVAPGQAVVCYDSDGGESVVAGGWIERRFAPLKSITRD